MRRTLVFPDHSQASNSRNLSCGFIKKCDIFFLGIGVNYLHAVFINTRSTAQIYSVDIKQITIPAEEHAFEQMFTTHYKGMYSYAYTILKDDINAEEITQNVFAKLWEKKSLVVIQSTLQGYLYRMVHNDCMNLLKHEAVKAKFEKEKTYTMKSESDNASKKILSGQLEERFTEALRELPEQCRTIFQLSRFEDLKYREIAQHLGIAEKTVENQMGKALKMLRIKLVDFLPFIIFITALIKKYSC